MDIKEYYKVWRKHNNIEVGDTVMISNNLRLETDRQYVGYIPSMEKYKGKNGIVTKKELKMGCDRFEAYIFWVVVDKEEEIAYCFNWISKI